MKKIMLVWLFIILHVTSHTRLNAAGATFAEEISEAKEMLKEPGTEISLKNWFTGMMNDTQNNDIPKKNHTEYVGLIIILMSEFHAYDYILETINNVPKIAFIKLQLIMTAIYCQINHTGEVYKPISYTNSKKLQALVTRINHILKQQFATIDYFASLIPEGATPADELADFAFLGILASLDGCMQTAHINAYVQAGLEKFLFNKNNTDLIVSQIRELLDAKLFTARLLINSYKHYYETSNQPLHEAITALLNEALTHKNDGEESQEAAQETDQETKSPQVEHEHDEHVLKSYFEKILAQENKALETEEKSNLSSIISYLLGHHDAYDYFLNIAKTTKVHNTTTYHKISCILEGIYLHVVHHRTIPQEYKPISYANCSKMTLTLTNLMVHIQEPESIANFFSYYAENQELNNMHGDLAYLALLSRVPGCMDRKTVWQFFLNGLNAFVFNKHGDELLTHIQELVTANIIDVSWLSKAYTAHCKQKRIIENKEIKAIFNAAREKQITKLNQACGMLEDYCLVERKNPQSVKKMQKRLDLQKKLLARQVLKDNESQISTNDETASQASNELDADLAASRKKEKAKLKKKRQAETKKTQKKQAEQEQLTPEAQAKKEAEERAQLARRNEIIQEQAEAARNIALQQQAHEKLTAQNHNASQEDFQSRASNRQYKKAEKRMAQAHRAAQRTQQHAAHIEKNQPESPAHADAPTQPTTANNEVKALEAELEKLSLDDGNDDQEESKQPQAESVWKGSVQETNFNVLKNKLNTASSTGDVAFLSYLIFKPEFGEYKPLAFGDYHIYQYSKNDLQQVLNAPLDGHGNRALHIAIMHGKLAFALQLINSFKIINKFVKNDQGDRPADLLLRYIRQNQKVFHTINIHINLEEPFSKELLQDEMTNWYASNSPQKNEVITTVKELVNTFARPAIRMEPKRNDDGEIKAYTIFELLEKFMSMDDV